MEVGEIKMQLLQWGAKEKRILKHIGKMNRGEMVESTKVAKALDLDVLTTGKIIAILFGESQLKIKRLKNDPSGRHRYEVL